MQTRDEATGLLLKRYAPMGRFDIIAVGHVSRILQRRGSTAPVHFIRDAASLRIASPLVLRFPHDIPVTRRVCGAILKAYKGSFGAGFGAVGIQNTPYPRAVRHYEEAPFPSSFHALLASPSRKLHHSA